MEAIKRRLRKKFYSAEKGRPAESAVYEHLGVVSEDHGQGRWTLLGLIIPKETPLNLDDYGEVIVERILLTSDGLKCRAATLKSYGIEPDVTEDALHTLCTALNIAGRDYPGRLVGGDVISTTRPRIVQGSDSVRVENILLDHE